MNENELIEKVRKYLTEKKITPINNEIIYTGIKKDAPQPDGTTKDMYVISFVIDFNKSSPYVEGISAIYIDVESKKLKFLLTPYYMKNIE